jgi:hypothetical protein
MGSGYKVAAVSIVMPSRRNAQVVLQRVFLLAATKGFMFVTPVTTTITSESQRE